MEAVEYVRERNKPAPGFIHAYVQGNLLVWLTRHVEPRLTVLPEINLRLRSGLLAVPDLALFQPLTFDFEQDVLELTDPLA